MTKKKQAKKVKRAKAVKKKIQMTRNNSSLKPKKKKK